MNRQLLAGYYSDVLIAQVSADYKDVAIAATRDLLRSLSAFETNLPPRRKILPDEHPANQLLAVYHNYIQRGLATHCSIEVEEYLARTWGAIRKHESDTGGVQFRAEEPSIDFTNQLFAALCVVDPRIGQEPLQNLYWSTWLGSDLEKHFLNEILLHRQGNHWLQLLEPQRSITNILEFAYRSGAHIKELYNQPIDNMGEQRVDFAVELPCIIGEGRRGLILEVDGSQHLYDRVQFNLDQYRDRAISCLEHTKWATLRARSRDWGQVPQLLRQYDNFFQDRYFKKIEENYSKPLYSQKGGLRSLHLALTPLAVARIQKVLVELIWQGVLKIDAAVWRIAIAERDVDCGQIAIDDFCATWNRLCLLSGLEASLPPIELTIYATQEFTAHPQFSEVKRPFEEATSFIGDVLIDISMLQRWGLTEPVGSGGQVYTVLVRSAHSQKEMRHFESAPLIRYQPLMLGDDPHTERVAALEMFVQSAFRKAGLRPGQLPIINKALQYQSVIGLLPTGGGKSLTYQVCSLLQPGITVVIDPIKSLMQDQNEGLRRNDIDATVFINSSLKTYYERKWAQEQVANAQVLFAFISPERLQIPAFRAELKAMADTYGHYFSYCVIDEAHCVSEWGHDFRTSYLRLGDNARLYCKTWKGKEIIALFGLTATASFDVLSDVKRELRIGDEGVISELGTQRKELIYQVHEVRTGLNANAIGYAASQAVGVAKVQKLQQLLRQLPHEVELNSTTDMLPRGFSRDRFFYQNEKDKFENAALIFCPHKSERSPMGVDFVAPRVGTAEIRVGTFYGADARMDNEVSLSERNQDKYIRNELNVLVATKAFGMGIDKPNVRSTVHFNFPSSIESFVQEAGRAGRDRKRAICHILYSDAKEVDRGIIASFHANNFRGVEHDFEMLVELLEEISFPAEKIYNQVAQHVFDELGEVVQISLWPAVSPRRIYVNRAFNVGYGYLEGNALNRNFVNVHADIGEGLAEEVLSFIAAYINTNCIGGDKFQWLKSEVIGNKRPGIEAVLAKAQVGQQLPDVEIGFRNNRINVLTQLLQDSVDDRFTELLVQRAAEYCTSLEDFLENLEKEFRRRENESINPKLRTLSESDAEQLKEWFYQVRDETDTFKAIYRLTLLGALDDYEVDYARKSITVKATKKTDADYLLHLEEYLSRYLSPKNVAHLMESRRQANKGSVIRDCAWVLIQYVYDFIGKKRSRAITEMQSLCEEAIGTQDHEQLERSIHIYFTSKFTERIRELINEGVDQLEIVQMFIDEANGIGDELEHLRGSAARLLTDNPDDGAMLLLRAYASLLLETKYVQGKLTIRSQFLVDKALDDLTNGLAQFEKNGYLLIEVLQYIKGELLLQNPGLDRLVEEVSVLLSVQQHTKWLKTFNNQFIGTYEHA